MRPAGPNALAQSLRRYCQELWIGNFLQAADPPVQAAIVSSD